MSLNKYFIFAGLFMIVILFGCSAEVKTTKNELDGIELEVMINKSEVSLQDEVTAKVILTNHHEVPREIFAPVPVEREEGIAVVMIENTGEELFQLLDPQVNHANSTIKGRSLYDFVRIELGAGETIEQEFHWNKKLFQQETGEIIEAESGEYILSAFIILDEIDNQEDYYEPEKQLIAKLNIIVN